MENYESIAKAEKHAALGHHGRRLTTCRLTAHFWINKNHMRAPRSAHGSYFLLFFKIVLGKCQDMEMCHMGNVKICAGTSGCRMSWMESD